MRILHLSQESPMKGHQHGGLGIFLENLLRCQAKMGYDVTILCVNIHSIEFMNIKYDGYRVVQVGNSLYKTYSGHTFYQKTINRLLLTGLLNVLGKEEFDLIHLHDSYLFDIAFSALHLFKCPVVSTSHLSFILEYMYRPGGHYAVFEHEVETEKCMLTQSHAVTTCSKSYADDLKRHYRLDRDVIPVLNGIDFEKFQKIKPNYELVKLHAGTRKPVYFCGRLTKNKGVGLVIEAIKKCPDHFFFVISNFAPDLVPTYDLARELRDLKKYGYTNYLWLNECFGEQFGILKACVMSLIPTISKEPFGIVGLETLACGVTPISTRTGGLSEFLDDSNSIKCDRNADSLIDKINNFQHDPKLEKNGLQTAKAMSWERTTEQYMEVYENVRKDFQFDNRRNSGPDHAHKDCGFQGRAAPALP